MTSGANIEAALRQSQNEAQSRAEAGRRRIYHDMIDAMGEALYSFDTVGAPSEDTYGAAMARYRNDAMFHAKVNTLVDRAMGVIRNSGLGI